jgi:hypothetical protein
VDGNSLHLDAQRLEQKQLDVAKRRREQLRLRLEHGVRIGHPRRDELDVLVRALVGAMALVLEHAFAARTKRQAERVVRDEVLILQRRNDCLLRRRQPARNNYVDLAGAERGPRRLEEVRICSIKHQRHPAADHNIRPVRFAGACAPEQ